MKPRICGLLVLAVVSAKAIQPDDFGLRLVAFDKPYQLFVQQFCGWKELTPYETSCSPVKGVWNTKLFNEAREHAKKLFNLK